MNKIIIIFILNVIVFWIANEYKNINKKKILFYESARFFANDLIANINFNKKTIFDVFNANLINYNFSFVKTMENFFKKHELCSDCLSTSELNAFNEFLVSVGIYDADGTISNLSFHKVAFEQKIEILKNDYKRKVEPIFKVIIILGLALSILIV